MRKRLVSGVMVAAVVIGATGWLYAQSSGGRLEAVTASPSDVLVNASTSVLFTADISDSSFKRHDPLRVVLVRTDEAGNPIDIVGRMTQNGQRFGSRRNDSVYSLRSTFNEGTVGYQYYRVAGLFRTSPSFFFRSSRNADDDWDTDLRLLNDPRGTANRHNRLLPLLRKLVQYELSDIFTVTVVPFALPPDPGEAGKQTLAGIDSDGDGVRDDIQRYIALSASESALVATLSEYARVNQSLISATPTTDQALEAAASRRLLAACWDLLLPADGRETLDALRAEVANTPARLAAYRASDRLLSGRTYSLPRVTQQDCATQ